MSGKPGWKAAGKSFTEVGNEQGMVMNRFQVMIEELERRSVVIIRS